MTPMVKERNSSIDFFRLFSMLMVVGLHVLGYIRASDAIANLSVKSEIIWFLEICLYGAVNCFALISGFLGINSRHKSTTLINIVIQAVFYCGILTGAYVVYSLVTNAEISLRFIAMSLLPTVFGRYWYVSAYFCLFLFMPILNKIVDLPRALLKRSFIAIIIVFCILSRIQGSVSGLQNGYSFLWLAILYVLGAYIARYKPFEKWSVKVNLLGYFICVLFTFLSKLAIELLTTKLLGEAIMQNFFVAYTSPTVLLSAIFLLNIALKLDFKARVKKVLAFLAPAAFGVYLIHCHPFVLDIVFKEILTPFGEKAIYIIIPAVFLAIIAVFTVCILIELARIQLFKLLKVGLLVNIIANFLEKLIHLFLGDTVKE